MGLLAKIFGVKRDKKNKEERAVVAVADDDPEMLWSIEKARLTLWYFEESLAHKKAGQEGFCVKVKFSNADDVEHIWLNNPEFDGDGNLFGTVANEPVSVKSIKIDQIIGIESAMVSDWMIIENGMLTGGYTLRTLRNRFSENDRKDFDRSIPFHIDGGSDHFKLDFDTPEGAILCIEQAYRDSDMEKVLSCKDFYEEARLMLADMAFEVDQEMISSTAETLEASFIAQIEEHGMPDFSNIRSAFTQREKLTENHWVITELCTYPDSGISTQKLSTCKTDHGWRVLGVS